MQLLDGSWQRVDPPGRAARDYAWMWPEAESGQARTEPHCTVWAIWCSHVHRPIACPCTEAREIWTGPCWQARRIQLALHNHSVAVHGIGAFGYEVYLEDAGAPPPRREVSPGAFCPIASIGEVWTSSGTAAAEPALAAPELEAEHAALVADATELGNVFQAAVSPVLGMMGLGGGMADLVVRLLEEPGRSGDARADELLAVAVDARARGMTTDQIAGAAEACAGDVAASIGFQAQPSAEQVATAMDEWIACFRQRATGGTTPTNGKRAEIEKADKADGFPWVPVAIVGTVVVVGGTAIYFASRPKRNPRRGKARRGYRRCPRGMEVQTVLFDANRFTTTEAKAWLREHEFEAPKVDRIGSRATAKLRFRQRPPDAFVKKSFRTIGLASGVQAVVACPKRGRESDK